MPAPSSPAGASRRHAPHQSSASTGRIAGTQRHPASALRRRRRQRRRRGRRGSSCRRPLLHPRRLVDASTSREARSSLSKAEPFRSSTGRRRPRLLAHEHERHR